MFRRSCSKTSAMLRDRIVIGASAGGVPALETLVGSLPADLGAAVFIVMHLQPDALSRLPQILQRRCRLQVTHAKEGERIERGRVYVASPDQHLLLEGDHLRLTRGPRENRSRPAVDTLFRSAAYSHGDRVIGVILSGALDDGTAGLWSVKERGGTTVVQDPDEAEYDSMPRSAIQHVQVDHVVALKEMGPLLVKLTTTPVEKHEAAMSKELEIETKIALEGRALELGVLGLGPVTPYTCPECHGVLVALKEGGVPRFRCHTGHAYSINTLLAEVTGYVEEALWGGIRAIEESMLLLRALARHIRDDKAKDPGLADLLDEKAKDAQRRADLVRQALSTHQTLSEDNVSTLKTGG